MRRSGFIFVLIFGCAGDPPPPAPAVARVRPPDPAALHIGGTGALTPLVIRLSQEWARIGGVPRLQVEDSIGSGGGVRAAADGAVDLGTISRPLSEEEAHLGLVLLPMGRDVVALAAHPSVRAEGLSGDELVALYRGERRHFGDGTPAVVLLRDRSESANGALEGAMPGLKAAREEAARDHRLRVLYHDGAMAEALAVTPGSLGVMPLGAILAFRLPLKLLALDGITASTAAVAAGRWRPSRVLHLVARPDRLARAGAFLRFVRSAAGRAVIDACGYLPPAGDGAAP